jgi:hypothetical protein
MINIMADMTTGIMGEIQAEDKQKTWKHDLWDLSTLSGGY